MPNRLTRSVALATGLVLVTAGLAAANDRTLTEDGGAAVDPAVFERVHDQQGGDDGHLPSSSQNVRLVGKMRINQDQEGRVADVGALGNYAYVAAWAAPDCQKGGVYVFDISDPTAPKQINFTGPRTTATRARASRPCACRRSPGRATCSRSTTRTA